MNISHLPQSLEDALAALPDAALPVLNNFIDMLGSWASVPQASPQLGGHGPVPPNPVPGGNVPPGWIAQLAQLMVAYQKESECEPAIEAAYFDTPMGATLTSTGAGSSVGPDVNPKRLVLMFHSSSVSPGCQVFPNNPIHVNAVNNGTANSVVTGGFQVHAGLSPIVLTYKDYGSLVQQAWGIKWTAGGINLTWLELSYKSWG